MLQSLPKNYHFACLYRQQIFTLPKSPDGKHSCGQRWSMFVQQQSIQTPPGYTKLPGRPQAENFTLWLNAQVNVFPELFGVSYGWVDIHICYGEASIVVLQADDGTDFLESNCAIHAATLECNSTEEATNSNLLYMVNHF